VVASHPRQLAGITPTRRNSLRRVRATALASQNPPHFCAAQMGRWQPAGLTEGYGGLRPVHAREVEADAVADCYKLALDRRTRSGGITGRPNCAQIAIARATSVVFESAKTASGMSAGKKPSVAAWLRRTASALENAKPNAVSSAASPAALICISFYLPDASSVAPAENPRVYFSARRLPHQAGGSSCALSSANGPIPTAITTPFCCERVLANDAPHRRRKWPAEGTD